MTLQSMRDWLASLEAAGVSPDEEILVDVVSETENVTFRCTITGARKYEAHNEEERPYGALLAEDMCDDPVEGP